MLFANDRRVITLWPCEAEPAGHGTIGSTIGTETRLCFQRQEQLRSSFDPKGIRVSLAWMPAPRPHSSLRVCPVFPQLTQDCVATAWMPFNDDVRFADENWCSGDANPKPLRPAQASKAVLASLRAASAGSAPSSRSCAQHVPLCPRHAAGYLRTDKVLL